MGNIYEEQIKNLPLKLERGFDNYNPIIINGEVYKDSHRRILSEQYKRLDFIDYNNKRVLDVGCYNGYLAYEAIKRGALSYIGVDSNSESDGLEKVLDMAKIVKESNNLKNVSFIEGWCADLPNLVNIEDFDVVTVLSIMPANNLLDVLLKGSDDISWYKFIKDKVVYIEPVNHGIVNDLPFTQNEWLKKIEIASNKNDINIEFLTFTDYQNRPLIKLTNIK